MPTRYKNLWTVAFSHCQALNLPFKKFVICHLSSSQNFVNSIFTSTNLWTVIFLSLHCQAFTNKTYVYFFFPFFPISEQVYCIIALIIIQNYLVLDSISLIGQIECNQFAKNGRVVYAVKSHHQCNQAGSLRWPWMI